MSCDRATGCVVGREVRMYAAGGEPSPALTEHRNDRRIVSQRPAYAIAQGSTIDILTGRRIRAESPGNQFRGAPTSGREHDDEVVPRITSGCTSATNTPSTNTHKPEGCSVQLGRTSGDEVHAVSLSEGAGIAIGAELN